MIAVGDRVGHWTTIARAPSSSSGNGRWLCRCDCGTERSVDSHRLASGGSKSCGCARRLAGFFEPRRALGDRYISSHGYVLVYVGIGHRLAANSGGWAYEHRVVAERAIGRTLRAREVVHHKDGNKANNEPSNLEVFPSQGHHFLEHRSEAGERLRRPGEPNEQISCACGCKQTLERFDVHGRPRSFVSGHNRRKTGDRSNEEILRAFDGGESGPSIATRIGVSLDAVHSALRAARRERVLRRSAETRGGLR